MSLTFCLPALVQSYRIVSYPTYSLSEEWKLVIYFFCFMEFCQILIMLNYAYCTINTWARGVSNLLLKTSANIKHSHRNYKQQSKSQFWQRSNIKKIIIEILGLKQVLFRSLIHLVGEFDQNMQYLAAHCSLSIYTHWDNTYDSNALDICIGNVFGLLSSHLKRTKS